MMKMQNLTADEAMFCSMHWLQQLQYQVRDSFYLYNQI